MEATLLSVGKSVLNAAFSCTKSAISEEDALQLSVQRDQAYLKEELEMMKSFMMVAHEERDEHNLQFSTLVKKVRNVAYDAEDCLQDFSVHSEKPLWWRFPCTLHERRQVAEQMKELRLRVEHVSQEILNYHLIKDSTSKHATKSGESGMIAEGISDVNEAIRWAATNEKTKVDLVQLINNESEDLRVIAVWGTCGDLAQMSIIRVAYEDPAIQHKFEHRAWVRVMHPFNPIDFVQSLVDQFHSAVGVEALLGLERTGRELVEEFNGYVNEKYLIVLNGLSSIEEWDSIKTCLPDNKKGSRIIVSTPHVEVASLCTGQESVFSELKQFYTNQTLYAFHNKDSDDGTKLAKLMPSKDVATTSSNNSMVATVEIPRGQYKGADVNRAVKKSLTGIRTAHAFEESQIIGREKEKSDVVALLTRNIPGQELPVISVWGMGGLGKTILVKDVYQSKILNGTFEKRAFVTVMRPFNLEEVLKSIAMQLDSESSEKKIMIDFWGHRRKKLSMMGVDALNKELARILERKRCLIVLDDLSSTAEWDMIIQNLSTIETTSRIIVTTREENIAMHCSNKQENIYSLKVLQYKDALDLFTKKREKIRTSNFCSTKKLKNEKFRVFKETIALKKYPELIEEAEVILKKCNGLPLAIVTIGGFLANQQKKTVEWRKLNKHLGAELEMNPELEAIRTILKRSYDGLPYHLKYCFLYMAIFSEDHKISQRRLVRRWTAEGYSREIHDKSEEEIAGNYFMELICQSMILPSQQSVYSRKGIDSCHIHDLMRAICISKATEENLVLRLEEGRCSSYAKVIFRHLMISSNWKGDESEFYSIADLSHVRSLTVFGKVRPFFISEKMRFLQVLDLEDTEGLVDHHLQQIGKLYHLKYLSLRRCGDIYYLPDSWGNLRQLQTLDIAFTNIQKLPKTITRLTKLRFLRAGSVERNAIERYKEMAEDLPKIASNRLSLLTLCSVACCMAWCAPQLLKWSFSFDGEPNRHDVCTGCCCSFIPSLATQQTIRGVQVPRGIQKLKSLQTMGLVNLAHGTSILKDIKLLTQLRKLAVTGVSWKNGPHLCDTIVNLRCLESLLLQAEGYVGLTGWLDEMSLPLENLQSLKMYGILFRLPKWIKRLQNLVKLTLRGSRIQDVAATIEALGKLPNLTILRLMLLSFLGEELHFNFRGGAFLSLMMMEFDRPYRLNSVRFQEGAMPKLEFLDFCAWHEESHIVLLSGLPYLTSLKEFLLSGSTYDDDFMEDLRTQLARNPNRPIFKRTKYGST